MDKIENPWLNCHLCHPPPPPPPPAMLNHELPAGELIVQLCEVHCCMSCPSCQVQILSQQLSYLF